MRVVVIGAGLGGLCLAHGLLRAGIEVIVYEKQMSPRQNASGYGIHIDINGKRALRQCLSHDLWARFMAQSTPAGTKVLFRDPQLRLLAEKDDAQISQMPALEIERRGIGRTEFRDILLEGLMDPTSPVVHWGKTFETFELLDEQVRIHFADGSSVDGDVLVGADGSHSRVREQYIPKLQRVDLGINAIAGRCVLDDKFDLPSDLIDGSLNNIVPFGKGWMFISAWNLPTAKSMQHHLVWAYVMPQQKSLQDLSPHQLQNVVIECIKDWSPGLGQIVRATDLPDISCIPLRTMPHLEEWAPSNVTVLGDAIHNMTPMAGAGANTALRDAHMLANMLGDAASGAISITCAIDAYEKKMREYANKAVELSKRNAISASSERKMERAMFRMILQTAKASSFVMRNTLGRGVAMSA